MDIRLVTTQTNLPTMLPGHTILSSSSASVSSSSLSASLLYSTQYEPSIRRSRGIDSESQESTSRSSASSNVMNSTSRSSATSDVGNLPPPRPRPAPMLFMDASQATTMLEPELPSFNTTHVVHALNHARLLVRHRGKVKRRLQRSLNIRWNKWMEIEVNRAINACMAAKLRYEMLRDAYISMLVSPGYPEWEGWMRGMWEHEKVVIEKDLRDAEKDDDSTDEESEENSVEFHHKLPQEEDVERSMDAWRHNRGERMRDEGRQPRCAMGNRLARRQMEPKGYQVKANAHDGNAQVPNAEAKVPEAEAKRDSGGSKMSNWAKNLPRKVSSVFRIGGDDGN